MQNGLKASQSSFSRSDFLKNNGQVNNVTGMGGPGATGLLNNYNSNMMIIGESDMDIEFGY